MKKWLGSILTVVLLTGSVLAGCSGSTPSSDDSGGSGDKVAINFVHWRGEDSEVFDEIIKKFENENENISVTTNVYPSDSYQEKVQATLLSGKGADVFATFPGSQFAELQKAGSYVDLTEEDFVNRFKEALLEAGQRDGKQLALPYQNVFNIPVYNKGIFEELGLEPPKSWDEFLKVSATLKENGYAPVLFSGDVSPSQFINPMAMNNMPSKDAFAQLETGEQKLTNDWYVKTLSQIKELADKGYFQDNPLGTKKSASAALFAQEKGAMLALGSYMMATVKQQNPDIEQGLLSPITVSADEAEWEGIHTSTFMLGINSKSDHKEAALKFLEFLTKPEIASLYANETGQLLTLKDIEYNSPALKESAKWLDKKTMFQPRYTISVSEISSAVETSVSDVVGGMDPEKAAEKAQKEVESAIK
jgi:raffinose/stachyose/melibiose transport system substrate-binding protein